MPIPLVAPAIKVEGLSLSFAGKPLFQDLNLSLEAGYCTCLLGPSGCGKSTLLKLIAGSLSAPYQGEVCLVPSLGHNQVAWMGQSDLLLPWLTLEENVLLGPRLRGENSPQKKAQAADLIKEAGLAGYETLLPSALSGGMRQRCALLRTLMENRPVLLMDEPFSALDSLTRMRLQNLAAHLTQGATVILVTHDPLEALRLGHRIVLFSGSPVRVLEEITLQSKPPREVSEPEVVSQHAHLLQVLLAGAHA